MDGQIAEFYKCCLAQLEFGASHDEGGEEVQGVNRWSGGGAELSDLVVDELIGLRGDVASYERGFEDSKREIGACRCGGWSCGRGLGEDCGGVVGAGWRRLRR